jgi:hypothetical protein
MRAHFASKSEIVARFARRIDDEILARATTPPAGQSPRDTIFEVVMSRFDALAPYRAALKSIHAAGVVDPTLARGFFASQAWMLNAAGVGTDGIEGGIKIAGLASVYASVFQAWLDDDDPGLARTMAALDRRLRRGERMLASLDGMANAVRRVAGLFRPADASASRPAEESKPSERQDGPAPGSASVH